MSWQPFIHRARLYLMNLRDKSGTPVMHTRKKTALIGFLANIQSINGIFGDLCEGPQPKLMYVNNEKLFNNNSEDDKFNVQ